MRKEIRSGPITAVVCPIARYMYTDSRQPLLKLLPSFHLLLVLQQKLSNLMHLEKELKNLPLFYVKGMSVRHREACVKQAKKQKINVLFFVDPKPTCSPLRASVNEDRFYCRPILISFSTLALSCFISEFCECFYCQIKKTISREMC